MKNVRILFLLIMVCVSTMVKAQSADVAIGASGWQGLRFSYNSYTLDVDDGNFDAVSAYEIGYAKGMQILKDSPLFLETGASLFVVRGDLQKWCSIKMNSLVVPLNMGYKVCSSEKISFFPYLGVALKGHISGELDVDGYGDIDMFDNSEFGDKCNRMQLGWQIGMTMNVNDFNVGFSYGTDFLELDDDTETKTLKITVGFNF